NHRLLQHPHVVSTQAPTQSLHVDQSITLNRFARAMPGKVAASVLCYSQKTGPKIGCKTEKPVQILRISFQQSHFVRRQSYVESLAAPMNPAWPPASPDVPVPVPSC